MLLITHAVILKLKVCKQCFFFNITKGRFSFHFCSIRYVYVCIREQKLGRINFQNWQIKWYICPDMETNCWKQCYLLQKLHESFCNPCAWGGKGRKDVLIIHDEWLDTSWVLGWRWSFERFSWEGCFMLQINMFLHIFTF